MTRSLLFTALTVVPAMAGAQRPRPVAPVERPSSSIETMATTAMDRAAAILSQSAATLHASMPSFAASLASLQDLRGLASLEHLGNLESLSSLKSFESLESLKPFKSLESLEGLSAMWSEDDRHAEGRSSDRLSMPRAPWASQDPADSLYRLAREALSRGDYRQSADLFRRLADTYPRSTYAGDAMYYHAFALYRGGNTADLRTALGSLESLSSKYPAVAKRGDTGTLKVRICGELARRGDERCASQVVRNAESPQNRACPTDDDEDERIAALNALMQIDAERAIPILEKVLARRDECSAVLRRKAVFLVSQKRTPAAADILLRVAKTDPDRKTREDAVFWMSQVRDERVIDMLGDVLKDPADEGMQDKAIFALSQIKSTRAQQLLRDEALKEGSSNRVREQSIFWLGQQRTQETSDFLKGLYAKVNTHQLKDKILFSLSQQHGFDNDKFLMDVATNEKETIQLRKQALFWAGQNRGTSIEDLTAMYERMADREMREQLIFVYSQRRDAKAVDKLLDIAKNDKDRELRKKAIFWLGQSKDPRAVQFLADLIGL